MICDRVVDVAVEATNTALLASFDAAQRIDVGSVFFLDEAFFVSADTACTATFQALQKSLDGEFTLQNSSSTIDLSAAAAEGSSGALLPSVLFRKEVLTIVASAHAGHQRVHSMHAADLLTISRRLYLAAPGDPTPIESAYVPAVAQRTARRYITPSNQVVGGVFLHNTRHSSVVSCSPRFSEKLTLSCLYSRATGQVIRGAYYQTIAYSSLCSCTCVAA